MAAVLLACLSAAVIDDARAQVRPTAADIQAMRTALNDQTLLIATGHPRHAYVGIALDITGMLAADRTSRLIPVMGGGAVANLRDLLLLRGIDLAIVPSNVLADSGVNQVLGDSPRQRLSYIARLYGEELHVLAGRGIKSPTDLNHRKIAVPVADDNALFTAEDLLKRLDITATIVRQELVDAVDQIRAGELAAMILIGAKPLQMLSGVPRESGLQLLGFGAVPALGDGYTPATFTASDYPALVPPGTSIETVAITAVLMSKSAGDRESRTPQVIRFTHSFFRGLTEHAATPRHPKWGDVNLAATVPGWTRFRPAQDWLEDAKRQQTEWLQSRFGEFLSRMGNQNAAALSPEQRQKLFDEFVTWSRDTDGQRPQTPQR